MEIVLGTLKGYDQLMNLVLDDVQETLRGLPYFFWSTVDSLMAECR